MELQKEFKKNLTDVILSKLKNDEYHAVIWPGTTESEFIMYLGENQSFRIKIESLKFLLWSKVQVKCYRHEEKRVFKSYRFTKLGRLLRKLYKKKKRENKKELERTKQKEHNETLEYMYTELFKNL